jgi:hypothetical protein
MVNYKMAQVYTINHTGSLLVDSPFRGLTASLYLDVLCVNSYLFPGVECPLCMRAQSPHSIQSSALAFFACRYHGTGQKSSKGFKSVQQHQKCGRRALMGRACVGLISALSVLSRPALRYSSITPGITGPPVLVGCRKQKSRSAWIKRDRSSVMFPLRFAQ